MLSKRKIPVDFVELQGTKIFFDGSKYSKDSLEFQQFVASVLFYMVIFQATCFIKEGKSGDNFKNYVLFGTVRNLYQDKYIQTNLHQSSQLSSSVLLSSDGVALLNTYRDTWNKIDNHDVWKYDDLWPIYQLIKNYADMGNLKDLFARFLNLQSGSNILSLHK